MKNENDLVWVRFTYICPYCEKRQRIELRMETDADIQVFDCCECFGSLGVLTDDLEGSLTNVRAKNGSWVIRGRVSVFQYEDIDETEAGFLPDLGHSNCPFIPGRSYDVPGLPAPFCLN